MNETLGRQGISRDAEALRALINSQPVPSGATDHGSLAGLADDDHTQYVHLSIARSITAQHTFAPGSTQAPFALGANAQSQLVVGLRADELYKQVTGANGLTGGGYLTSNQTISLNTPGTLSVSSTNSASTNHTHAISSYSNPGSNARLLATAADGGLQLLRLGIGADPDTDERLTMVDGGQIGLDTGPLMTFVDGDYLLLEGGALRIAYNTSYYADLETDSDGTLVVTPVGNLTLQPAGDITIDPEGRDVLPYQNYDINIGAINKKYLTLHAAELWVETLVAHETMATIGGRILVGPTTVYEEDVADTDNVIWVKHNQMRDGDVCYSEANMRVEFMRVLQWDGSRFLTTGMYQFSGEWEVFQNVEPDGYYAFGDFGAGYGEWSAISSCSIPGDGTTYVVFYMPSHYGYPSTIEVYYLAQEGVQISTWEFEGTVPPYGYPVTRDLDGSGANDWYAGDALFNTGETGDGFIDLYSINGIHAGTQYGPTIVGNVRGSSTYNDWIEHWAIGNLNGIYGYGTDTYGAAFGKYDNGQSFLTVDATNGIRMRARSGGTNTTLAQWSIAGTILVGEEATGRNNVYITSTGLRLRRYTTTLINLQADGDVFIGEDTSSASSTFLSIFTNAQTYNSESMSAGDVLLGDNSASKANILWDKSAGKLLFRGGQTTQVSIETSGALSAGLGKVILNTDGLTMVNSSYAAASSLKWQSTLGATTFTNIYGEYSGAGSGEFISYAFTKAINSDANGGASVRLLADYTTDAELRLESMSAFQGGFAGLLVLIGGTQYLSLNSSRLSITGDIYCSDQISTNSGSTQWDLGGFSSAGDASSNGYVTVTINGTACKLMTRA